MDGKIQHGLEQSAALLAVSFPELPRLGWWDDERNKFLDLPRHQQVKAGSYHRFLKVIKTPWPDNDHELFYSNSSTSTSSSTARRA